MLEVNVTELRSHLPQYLAEVRKGDEILVTLHGQVIARILPPVDRKQEAQRQLHQLRQHCRVGDVIAPIDTDWEAEK